ncbi:MAG: 16S rRNA (guanine(527)-N(7))-methyltransferase RsmG [Rubrobacteraceae bacterium]|nr:16S rRNA (guanine(527)-N(7))-methyltransferase RsmG [Rubrobacteraceae bacterium]
MEFAQLLASYDRANVIGTRDLDGILLSHVLDSLSCFVYEPLFRAGRLADVGSGGGLPGIPIAIVGQDLETTLIESTGKKAAFMRYAVESLGLEGVRVANERVEYLGRTGEHRGAYDIVTCRAVARLSVVAEYCVPLLEVGGRVIAMKGRLGPEELSEGSSAEGVLGATVAEVKHVPMLPEVGQKERNLVIIQKTGETPARYPRRAGVVARKPLGS